MFTINPIKSILTLLIAMLMVFSLAGFAGATALSADKTYVVYTAGEELDFPVYTNTDIYTGGLVMVNATGYAIPGSDTAGGIFVGVSTETVDNNPAASGAKTVTVMRRGLHLMALGHAISQANVGDNVFIVDDQTVDVTANVSNGIYCGIIAKYVSSTRAYIDIVPAIQQADVATHIADGTGAHAASAISIADSGLLITGTTAEAALAELAVKCPVLIADPGDAGVIPVARSGHCALTSTTIGGETRTIAVPAIDGITLSVTLAVDGGDVAITVASAINQTGNTVITMGDAGDTIVLTAVRVGAARAWRVVVNDGTALSTP